jgi:hypothetical protein
MLRRTTHGGKMRYLIAVSLLGLALAYMPSGTALGAANIGRASCEGIGVSNVAPGQISKEFEIPAFEVHTLVGAALFAHDRKSGATEAGVSPGSITSQDAQRHLNDPNATPEECFPE